MATYHEWLLKQSPTQRASLASASTTERLDKIKNLRNDEVRRTADRAEPADLDAIAAWLQTQVYEKMTDDRKRMIDELTPEDRRGAVMLYIMSRPPQAPSRMPQMTKENLAALRETLSQAGQEKLDALRDDDHRRRVLAESWDSWFSQAMRDSIRRYFEGL